jgi:hypothetical protein
MLHKESLPQTILDPAISNLQHWNSYRTGLELPLCGFVFKYLKQGAWQEKTTLISFTGGKSTFTPQAHAELIVSSEQFPDTLPTGQMVSNFLKNPPRRLVGTW